jgi:hypothetical protein
LTARRFAVGYLSLWAEATLVNAIEHAMASAAAMMIFLK